MGLQILFGWRGDVADMHELIINDTACRITILFTDDTGMACRITILFIDGRGMACRAHQCGYPDGGSAREAPTAP